MEKNEWDYTETCSEVWFDELIKGKIYKFILPHWYEELSRQHTQSKRDIKLSALSINNQKLQHGLEILKSEEITLSLWRAIYDKWKKAKKKDISKERPVIIELIRSDTRKWRIISVMGIK